MQCDAPFFPIHRYYQVSLPRRITHTHKHSRGESIYICVPKGGSDRGAAMLWHKTHLVNCWLIVRARTNKNHMCVKCEMLHIRSIPIICLRIYRFEWIEHYIYGIYMFRSHRAPYKAVIRQWPYIYMWCSPTIKKKYLTSQNQIDPSHIAYMA